MTSFQPTIIPGLRGASEKTGGLVFFARMLDKMRLSAAGTLPEAWDVKRGDSHRGSFDWRCCHFLGIRYADLEAEVLKGDKSDAELLEWAFANGHRPDEVEIEVWNGFMTKCGWRDRLSSLVSQRLSEMGLPPDTVPTMFEVFDVEEGRVPPPVA